MTYAYVAHVASMIQWIFIPRPTDPVETSRPEPGTLAEVTVCVIMRPCVSIQLLYFAIECINVRLWHDERLAYFVFYSVSSNPHHDKMIGMIWIVLSLALDI